MLFVIISALFYVLSFIASEWLWWTSFVFPFFLFVSAEKKSISFVRGYIWGTLAYGVTLISIYVALFDMSVGPFLIRLFPSLLLFFYLPLFPACSFYVTQKVFTDRLVAAICGLLVSLYLVDNYALLICGRYEGYMLAHPLIPLCQMPPLLWLLPYIGVWFLTCVWISVPLFFFLSLQNTKYILVSFIFVFLFIVGFFFPTKEIVPPWKESIVAVPKLFGPVHNTHTLVRRVRNICTQIITEYPQVETIIFPEGALYCKDLAYHQLLTTEWSEKQLGKKVHIIVGTFHQEGDNLYNSLQWFYDGRFIETHHKQHVLPVTERLPWWLSFSWYKEAYFSNISQITPSLYQKKPFMITDQQNFLPFICSEFFCTHKALEKETSQVPLVVCNDSWFWFVGNNPYIQTLMRLGAQFRAITSQQSLVYVAFSCAYYIDMYGNLSKIVRFHQ